MRYTKNGVIFEVDKDRYNKLVKPMLLRFFALLYFAHPFHVSVCDAAYNEENKSIEIIYKLFYDDFGEVLKAFAGQDVDLSDQQTSTPIITRYVNKKFGIVVNGKARELNILGYELDEGSIWIYIEVPKVKKINEAVYYNTMLTEVFDDQENLLHMKVSGKTKSLKLNGLRSKGTLNWP